ncbi:MAG: type II toxin-antitoxin system VapC family toxin [Immundisolibacterales bacterium]|nr:type II toxin-antitoxin system VapC family toxin [Immundisolibacterales bacterium]
MRYLLDTHALLWARSAPERLSAEALSVLQSTGNTLYVSMASLWECAIKASIGKLDVPIGFWRIVSEDYEILGIELSHVEACASLPMHHRDPFDRLLVAQAQLGGLVLVTRDPDIARYDVLVVRA